MTLGPAIQGLTRGQIVWLTGYMETVDLYSVAIAHQDGTDVPEHNLLKVAVLTFGLTNVEVGGDEVLATLPPLWAHEAIRTGVLIRHKDGYTLTVEWP